MRIHSKKKYYVILSAQTPPDTKPEIFLRILRIRKIFTFLVSDSQSNLFCRYFEYLFFLLKRIVYMFICRQVKTIYLGYAKR